MGLSADLIQQFAKMTNVQKKEKKESTVYGQIVEHGGKNYVQIDGSELLTPIITTVEAKPGDRVTVLLKNHTATVTGNITSPAVRTETVNVVVKNIDDVNEVLANKVNTDEFDATNAKISKLESSITQLSDKITSNVTETTNLGTRMTTVEQSASDLTVRMSASETNVTNAAKTATNFLSFDSTNGLLVGNKSSGSWSGTRAQLKSDAFNVLDSSGTVMASYGTTTTIGKSTANNVYIDSDSIDIRKGTTVLATFDQYGLKIANSNDASGSLCSGTSKPALVIGSESGYHIEMDNNEIMAKSDATTTSHLFLNMEGGNVSVNNNCDRAIMFQDGTLYAKNKNYNSGNWLSVVDGLNEVGNTAFGYGGYLQEIGATDIYGNDIYLYSKGNINANTSFVVRNGSSFQGTNASGEIRNNLQPCNTNDNCVIGYGSYTAGEGATNIYGKTISLTCDDLKLNGTSYDSGWKTPSISSELTNHDSNTSNALKYRRVGKVVDICGSVSPTTTSALADGKSVTAFTLPSGYRPARTRTYLCQGSNLSIFMLQIQSGGAVAISRYRDTGATAYPTSVATTTWLPISATFTID